MECMQSRSDLEQCVGRLKSESVAERAEAAETLCTAAPESSFAAAELVRACADEDESVREWVVGALESIEEPPANALEALEESCRSDNALVAYWAVTMMGRMGCAAKAKQDVIAQLLENSKDLSVQEKAAWALGKMEADSSLARHALEQASHSENARLSRVANAAL